MNVNFEPVANGTESAHYSIFRITGGIDAIREFFKDGPDEMNFCLFSTSGIHGSYCTIEDVEKRLDAGAETDYITILIVQPRIVCMRYGDIEITKDDIPYLKELREKSWSVINKIGR